MSFIIYFLISRFYLKQALPVLDVIVISLVNEIIQSVIEGFNGTIFAYGQTGTGKTHTMVGNYYPLNNEQRGIIPRSLEYLFEKINQNTQSGGSNGYQYDVSCAFTQIYMEMIQDLINPQEEGTSIKIREDPCQGVFISGLQWVPIKSTKQGMIAFSNGEKNRATSFTKMNAHSSRSHAVFMVKIEKRKQFKIQDDDSDIMIKGKGDTIMTTSMLYLVDLAGSERVKKSQVSASRLDEAKKINFSLAALGNCIHALTDSKTSHVPFRDSKLTRLLSDSLGGNSKTAMVVTIGPSKEHTEETLMTLQFAQRAMKVENTPQVNKIIDYRILNLQLQNELDEVNDQLTKLQIKYAEVLEKLQATQNENDQLKITTRKNINLNDTIDNNKKLMEIQQTYDEIIKKKDFEYKKFLEEVDVLMQKQELQIEELKNNNSQLNSQIQNQQQIEIEKNELEQRVIQLSSELVHLKRQKEKIGVTWAVKANKMKKQYDQEKEQLELKIQEFQNTHSQLQQSYHNQKLTLQQEVQTFQEKIMNIEKQYQDEIQKMKFDNDQEIESYKIQITQLKQENEKSHYEFSAQIDKLQNDYNFLNQEKQNMKTEFEDTLQSKYLLYQTEIKSIQTSNQEVIEKMKMQFELQIQQSQNDQQQIINKKEEEIQYLKQKQEQEIRRLIQMIEKKDKQIEEITIKANKLKNKIFIKIQDIKIKQMIFLHHYHNIQWNN